MKSWSWSGLMLVLLIGLQGTASAMPLLSEVYYDAAGKDGGKVFVELYGPSGESLEGLQLLGTNGAGGSVVFTVDLSGVFPEDGFFVVADGTSGVTAVANADLIVANVDHQNGPENFLLLLGGSVLDALGFGDFSEGDVFEGEGTAASDAPAGSSLARWFANVDTDDNAVDFTILSLPTPGEGMLSSVPEPGSLVLCAMGLVSLASVRRRRG
ncbi:MAG: PEP-CTERM sorting domain-containing protein [Deltaproteobacteria bacterium]|nr:PEP-CTERM sorting domain-containing protein [Deltaproteobacteria bacterium]